MLEIEVDIAYAAVDLDETLEDVMAGLLEGCWQATWEVVNPHGPGGGWPVVKVVIPDSFRGEFAERYGCGSEEFMTVKEL